MNLKTTVVTMMNYKCIYKLYEKLDNVQDENNLILTQTGFHRKNVRNVLLCIKFMTLLVFHGFKS